MEKADSGPNGCSVGGGMGRVKGGGGGGGKLRTCRFFDIYSTHIPA